MALDNAKVTNSRTGTVFEILELGETRVMMRYTMQPHMKVPDIAEHFHTVWDEEFNILEGEGEYRLGGEKGTVKAGETLAMPRGVKHVHPWNTGAERMVMDQTAIVDPPHPRAIRDTLGVIFSLYKAEAEGRIALDKVGIPKNPVKFAATGRIFARNGSYDARFPKAMQDGGAATMGRLVEALGVDMIDPEFR
ncbi:MAG: cupin domain-containing protein [Boseongicola sp.]|nr:cupin domain-containing protein [Boseongicola sp.]